jgi:pectate lyase
VHTIFFTMRWWLGWWMAVAVTLVGSAVEGATILYLGLPNGATSAYATNGTGWTRVGWADLPDVGANAFPALADLDGDGDLDAMVGHGGGLVVAFENAGTATTPEWVRRTDWDCPLDVGSRAAPALGDVDGDGRADLLVGSSGGNVVAFKNTGGSGGPVWVRTEAWDVAAGDDESRPALGDVNHDGKLDLAIGGAHGAIAILLGNGAGAFARAAAWDPPAGADRTAPGFVDFDGDGRPDLVVEDGNAIATVWKNTGIGWTAAPAAWVPPDPGSGPAGPALASGTLVAPVDGGDSQVIARIAASALDGTAPLRVTFDAGESRAASGASLSFAWDFGDGTSDGGSTGGGPGTGPGTGSGGSTASDILKATSTTYAAAKSTRDAGHYDEAIAQYLAVADTLLPLTSDTSNGTVSKRGTTQVNRVARWYLQKIAHDLGGIYLYHSMGLDTCGQYALAYLWSMESKSQAEAGGFPELPKLNGTTNNINRATTKLQRAGCGIPPASPMFGSTASALMAGGPTVDHVYTKRGTFVATVTASDGSQSAQAHITITVDGDDLPDSPGGPSDNDADASEGFGATTPGGEGGTLILVTEATEDAVRAAFNKANAGHAIVRFAVADPIAIHEPLPQLKGAFITIDGGGATLYGDNFPRTPGMVDVRGHDVIVKNIHLRNGGDNLRAQGDGAYNVVFRHVSSTGSGDDGISVGYGAHDVTIEWCFLAGNTRSIFMKYGDTTNVSIHHTWIEKQWVRGPLVSQSIFADIRNVIVEDWTLWGTRFEKASSGNVVNSLFVLSPFAKSVGGKTNSALRLNQDNPVFTAGNRYDGLAADGDEGTATTPLPAPAVTTLSVGEMEPLVRSRAGCLPRDRVDQGYIEKQDGWDVSESQPFRLGPGA